MRIPEVRELLLLVASELDSGTGMSKAHCALVIRKMVKELYRRPYKRKAPVQSRSIDPALKAALRIDALSHPDLTYQDIAVQHGVNAGRVSEAVAGKRR